MADENNTGTASTAVNDTILVAEDSPPSLIILGHLLKKLGFDVIACENGEEAWNKFADPQNFNIVCVISDIMMPKMDGIQLLRNVRGNEKGKDLPFILITTLTDKEYVSKARELNVNGYIMKPVNFGRVTSKLQELLPTHKFPKAAA